MKNSEKYPTAKERATAFEKFCHKNSGITDCHKCPLESLTPDCGDSRTQFAWLDLEAEDEKPLPCPFCGSRCLAIDGSKIAPDRHGVKPYLYVKCEKCGYESIMTDDYDKSGIEDIIVAHNRVAKAVMDAKESDAKHD